MNKIHLLWCTIRPQTFISMYKIWMERSSMKDIQTHVCVNTQEDYDIVKKVLGPEDECIIVSTDRKGVCFPSYALSSKLEGNSNDIVVFGSDDFMSPYGWDSYLRTKLNNRKGCLMVRDGYQLPDSSNMLHPCITIPIMTYDCLVEMNKVIYHPAYYHMFSDCELYLTLKELGLLIDERLSDTTVFEHMHYAAGKRNPDQNDVNYNLKWMEDDATWKKRSTMIVSERLKV